jgi:hypothetical protein
VITNPHVTAEADGRRLRLAVHGSPHQFLVDPLPAKRGLALAAACGKTALRGLDDDALCGLFAEALGPENFAVLTGDLVQEFDGAGTYLRTHLPGAVMVEPEGDVDPVAPGQRMRIIPSPWDGLDLRAEELIGLALAAVRWQSSGGRTALCDVLRESPDAGAPSATSASSADWSQSTA